MADPAEQVRSAVLGAIQTAADAAKATRSIVKDLALGALKDAGEIAANAAIFAGTVKAAVIGAADAGKGTIDGVRGAAGGMIQAASEMGVDLAQAASATLRGVFEAAGALGEDGRRFVQAAVDGMIDSAAEIGDHALVSVRRGLTEAASIPRDVVDAAVKRADDRREGGEPTGSGT